MQRELLWHARRAAFKRASCPFHSPLPTAAVMDKAIIEEDRDILESTDPDAIVDMHMPSDRPGTLMRKRLNALLEAHGEREVPR